MKSKFLRKTLGLSVAAVIALGGIGVGVANAHPHDPPPTIYGGVHSSDCVDDDGNWYDLDADYHTMAASYPDYVMRPNQVGTWVPVPPLSFSNHPHTEWIVCTPAVMPEDAEYRVFPEPQVPAPAVETVGYGRYSAYTFLGGTGYQLWTMTDGQNLVFPATQPSNPAAPNLRGVVLEDAVGTWGNTPPANPHGIVLD